MQSIHTTKVKSDFYQIYLNDHTVIKKKGEGGILSNLDIKGGGGIKL